MWFWMIVGAASKGFKELREPKELEGCTAGKVYVVFRFTLGVETAV